MIFGCTSATLIGKETLGADPHAAQALEQHMGQPNQG